MNEHENGDIPDFFYLYTIRAHVEDVAAETGYQILSADEIDLVYDLLVSKANDPESEMTLDKAYDLWHEYCRHYGLDELS